MLRDVKASKMQERTRFCVDVLTKKKAIVTAQEIVAVNTEKRGNRDDVKDEIGMSLKN